jgi:hypothetical protein
MGWPGVEPKLGDSSRFRPLPKSVILQGYSAALVPRSSLAIPTASDPSVTECGTIRKPLRVCRASLRSGLRQLPPPVFGP